LATPLNAEVQNMAKIGGFSPPEDDRINRSRRNLARKRRPLVCYSTLNLALIGERGSILSVSKPWLLIHRAVNVYPGGNISARVGVAKPPVVNTSRLAKISAAVKSCTFRVVVALLSATEESH